MGDLDGERLSRRGHIELVPVNGEDDVGGALGYLDGCAGFSVGGLDGDCGGALRDGSVLLGGDNHLCVAGTAGRINFRPGCAGRCCPCGVGCDGERLAFGFRRERKFCRGDGECRVGSSLLDGHRDALVVVVAEYDDTLAGFGGGVCLGIERVGVGVPACHLVRLLHPFRLRVDLVADVVRDLDGERLSHRGNIELILVDGEYYIGAGLPHRDGLLDAAVRGGDSDGACS